MKYATLIQILEMEIAISAPAQDVHQTLDLIATQYPAEYRCLLADLAITIRQAKGAIAA